MLKIVHIISSMILWKCRFGFKNVRGYDGTKYLALFGPEKYGAIFDNIGYTTGLKSGISYIASHNYVKVKFDSDDDFLLEK